MNLFEQTVNAVLAKHQAYAVLRPAVEKEILHQDILRTLSKAGFLLQLTFMGGTCLRSCYGFARLSEDLDFTGGFDFKKGDLQDIGELLKKAVWQKYNLSVNVLEPVKEEGNTHTWKIKIITAPERKDLPQQLINIDVCMLPSYECRPVMLKNHYGLEAGTSGLIIMAESLGEILADKIVAVAMRSNRVMNRDLWDIYQLKAHNIDLSIDLVKQKLIDRKIDYSVFKQRFVERIDQLKKQQQEFWREMQRFLSPEVFTNDFTDKTWWDNLLYLLKDWVLLPST
ncbi:MAG: nucleotidyl transferase AbiEii/AbiGii toxin family protein [Treponema sp.]|jgi:predicted nucleotidyltransferase component of viral defense system|nr:nucleotidyl transferase AbiEii/AbiGii toxin family protein [Treponema sp.]